MEPLRRHAAHQCIEDEDIQALPWHMPICEQSDYFIMKGIICRITVDMATRDLHVRVAMTTCNIDTQKAPN